MEIRKMTLQTETLFGVRTAQAQMESAIPLPQGKSAERVLSVGASATVDEVTCRDGAVVIGGTMTVQPVVEGTDKQPLAFEAAATFSHTIRMDGVTPDMNARVSAEIPACTLKREDGGLRMQATVQLSAAVFSPQEIPCITALEDGDGLEQMSVPLTLKRRKLLGAHSLHLRETLDAPRACTVLKASATPLVTALVKGTDGQLPQGELKLSVLFTEPDGGIRRTLYTVPYSDVVPCESGEEPYAEATLTRLNATVEEEGSLTVDATLSIGVYGSKTETQRILTDAYDATGSFSCTAEPAETLCYEGARFETVQMNETIPVPNHMKDAYLPLYASLRTAITQVTVQDGRGRIEGVLAVTVVYRDDDGMKQSFVHELPLSFDTEARGTLLLPSVCAYDAQLSGSGRTVSLKLTVTVGVEWYRAETFSYVPELSKGVPCETNAGMLVWFADENETLFSIGKRFSVPITRVRACNPKLTEPIAEGTPVMVLRSEVASM